MSKIRLVCIVGGFVPLLTIGLVAAGQHGSHPSQSQTLVDVVRGATAQFLDPEVALAAGYVPKPFCVSGPDQGAMGVHFVNPALVMDGQLDPERPESLVYESKEGHLRLVAVEYIVFADAWSAHNPQPPALFGQLLNYIAAPNRYGNPILRAPRVGMERQSVWHLRRLESASVLCRAFAKRIGLFHAVRDRWDSKTTPDAPSSMTTDCCATPDACIDVRDFLTSANSWRWGAGNAGSDNGYVVLRSDIPRICAHGLRETDSSRARLICLDPGSTGDNLPTCRCPHDGGVSIALQRPQRSDHGTRGRLDPACW